MDEIGSKIPAVATTRRMPFLFFAFVFAFSFRLLLAVQVSQFVVFGIKARGCRVTPFH